MDNWGLYAIAIVLALLPASANCVDKGWNPDISSTENGPAVFGPLVYGVNKVVRIWCRATNTASNSPNKLQSLFWRDNYGSRVYFQNHSDNSNPDVYSEAIDGTDEGNYTPTWIRVLHINRIQLSYAGVYTCTANYNRVFLNATVEVQVQGTNATSRNNSHNEDDLGTNATSKNNSHNEDDLGTSATSRYNDHNEALSPTPKGAIVAIGSIIAVLPLLGGVLVIALSLAVVMFRKRHSKRLFNNVHNDVSGMECAPLGSRKVELTDTRTDEVLWPGDTNGHALHDHKESAYAEVTVADEIDTSQYSEAVCTVHGIPNDVYTQPMARGGELELSMGPAQNVQDTQTDTAENSAILADRFADHVSEMHLMRDKGFEEEFKNIVDDPDGVHDIATANHSKNRYHNIHTFDHSRVILSVPDGWGSDYINASYINGEHGDVYIAAQGPTPETITDFWQMVLDVRPAVIVMLTKVDENGKHKCEQYWNNQLDKPYDAGCGFTVVTMGYRGYADHVVRDLTVTSPIDGPLSVKQFQYTGWPDHGVPLQPSSVIKFIQQVRKEIAGSDAPIVVHCSAGVGRTGTFITIDAMMERLKKKGDINIFEFVSEMRTKRMKMVQTLDQYVFIHDALCDYITCGDTSVPAHELRAVIAKFEKVDKDTGRTGFQEQFALLEKLSKSPCSEDIAFANKCIVAKRNRFKDKFPYSTNFLHLPYNSASNGTDYINATFISSYSKKRAFIAAQCPMEHTRNDIWDLIWQFKAFTVVLLCDFLEGNQETCKLFWPDESMGTFDCKGFKINYIDTLPMNECDKILLHVFNRSKLSSPPMEMTLYHFMRWTTTSPPPAASLLKVMGEVADIQREKDRPVLVMCDDGMSRSGVFITCMSEIERVKVEGGVDIFQTVKAARAQRPHMVYTTEQFKMCYLILQSYLELFNTYSNYKNV